MVKLSRLPGGGHYNHTLFWEVMAPKDKGGAPAGDLAKAINADFGGLAKLQDAMTTAGITRFGSGWSWLRGCFRPTGR